MGGRRLGRAAATGEGGGGATGTGGGGATGTGGGGTTGTGGGGACMTVLATDEAAELGRSRASRNSAEPSLAQEDSTVCEAEGAAVDDKLFGSTPSS